MSEAPAKKIRFGPYEADLAAGELRRNGRLLRMQEQPFQILAALLERPGDIVSRDELRERLWAGDTFVDFDQGLNTAINKLREALGDSASTPRFIETVPKRGYRFTFPLEPPLEVGAAAELQIPEVAQRGSRRRAHTLLVAAAAVGLVGIGIALWVRRPPEELHLPLRRFALRNAVTTVGTIVFNRSTAISPDGKHIAFIDEEGLNRRLWIQHMDQEHPKAVEGGEGAADPFWSPDSKVIGYLAGKAHTLMRISAEGGVPTRICDMSGYFFTGATWSPDGKTIVFGSGPVGLYEVSADGGTPKVIVSRDFLKLLGAPEASMQYLHTPIFLPARHGRRIIVFGFGWAPHGAQLVMRDLHTGRTEILGPGRLPAYSPTGHLIFHSSQRQARRTCGLSHFPWIN